MALTLLCAAFLTQASSVFGAGDPLDALAPKSVASRGNLARLDRVFERAMAGRHITIGVIGGSITQGAMATKPRYNYPSLVAQWFAKTFPKEKVSLVNAGVGATGTHYGCLRVQRDLLSHHPNLVIVEFAVNDGPQKSYSETYEGLIRHILSAPNSTTTDFGPAPNPAVSSPSIFRGRSFFYRFTDTTAPTARSECGWIMIRREF